jgi:hypothetical protein
MLGRWILHLSILLEHHEINAFPPIPLDGGPTFRAPVEFRQAAFTQLMCERVDRPERNTDDIDKVDARLQPRQVFEDPAAAAGAPPADHPRDVDAILADGGGVMPGIRGRKGTRP